jgi:hypothetical protein
MMEVLTPGMTAAPTDVMATTTEAMAVDRVAEEAAALVVEIALDMMIEAVTNGAALVPREVSPEKTIAATTTMVVEMPEEVGAVAKDGIKRISLLRPATTTSVMTRRLLPISTALTPPIPHVALLHTKTSQCLRDQTCFTLVTCLLIPMKCRL